MESFYLSLSDAVTLALENNYDIAIARINLDIGRIPTCFGPRQERLCAVSLPGWSPTRLADRAQRSRAAAVRAEQGSASGGSGSGVGGICVEYQRRWSAPLQLRPGDHRHWRVAESVYSGQRSLESRFLHRYLDGRRRVSAGVQFRDLARCNLRQQRVRLQIILSAPFRLYSIALFQLMVTQHLLQGFGPKINRRFILRSGQRSANY